MKLAELFGKPVPDVAQGRARPRRRRHDRRPPVHARQEVRPLRRSRLPARLRLLPAGDGRHAVPRPLQQGARRSWRRSCRRCSTPPRTARAAKIYMNRDLWHLRSLLMTDPVDALIGDTHGKFAARDAKIPLFRFGFPIFDRVNLHRVPADRLPGRRSTWSPRSATVPRPGGRDVRRPPLRDDALAQRGETSEAPMAAPRLLRRRRVRHPRAGRPQVLQEVGAGGGDRAELRVRRRPRGAHAHHRRRSTWCTGPSPAPATPGTTAAPAPPAPSSTGAASPPRCCTTTWSSAARRSCTAPSSIWPRATREAKAIFVYATCVTAMTGDDVEAVCRAAAKEVPIPVIPVEHPRLHRRQEHRQPAGGRDPARARHRHRRAGGPSPPTT